MHPCLECDTLVDNRATRCRHHAARARLSSGRARELAQKRADKQRRYKEIAEAVIAQIERSKR